MGNNSEIPKAGDDGNRDAGESQAHRMLEEVMGASERAPESKEAAKGVDLKEVELAKKDCEAKCGPMAEWMSEKTDPQRFKEKTEKLAAGSPAEIEKVISNNSEQAQAIQNYMAALEQKIAEVQKKIG